MKMIVLSWQPQGLFVFVFGHADELNFIWGRWKALFPPNPWSAAFLDRWWLPRGQAIWMGEQWDPFLLWRCLWIRPVCPSIMNGMQKIHLYFLCRSSLSFENFGCQTTNFHQCCWVTLTLSKNWFWARFWGSWLCSPQPPQPSREKNRIESYHGTTEKENHLGLFLRIFILRVWWVRCRLFLACCVELGRRSRLICALDEGQCASYIACIIYIISVRAIDLSALLVTRKLMAAFDNREQSLLSCFLQPAQGSKAALWLVNAVLPISSVERCVSVIV